MQYGVAVNFVVEASSPAEVEKLIDDIEVAYPQIKDSEIESGPDEITEEEESEE